MNPFDAESLGSKSEADNPPASIQLLQSQPFSHTSNQTSQQTSVLSSPSKSIKNYFRNRASLKSIDSVTEGILGHIDEEIIAGGSPSKKASLLTRPLFSRSRSSVASVGTAGVGAAVSCSPTRVTKTKPVEIEDFADSSSGSEYDAESINSILDEYEQKRKTKEGVDIFHEEFDESYDTSIQTKASGRRNMHRQKSSEKMFQVKRNDAKEVGIANKENVQNSVITKLKRELDGLSGNRSLSGLNSLGNRHLGGNRSSIISGNSSKSQNLLNKRTLRSKSIIELTLGETHHLTNSEISVNSPTTYYDAKQSDANSSTTSGTHSGFRIYNDADNNPPPLPSINKTSSNTKKTLVERKKVISASSNVDVLNRSSIYNMTTVSGYDSSQLVDKEGASGSKKTKTESQESSTSIFGASQADPPTRANTPTVSSETSSFYMSVASRENNEDAIVDYQEPLEFPLRSQPNLPQQTFYSDESALHNTSNKTQNTDTFSLSSGELLNTLQSQYGAANTSAAYGNIPKSNTSLVHPISVAKVVDVRLSRESPTRKPVLTPVRGKFFTDSSPSVNLGSIGSSGPTPPSTGQVVHPPDKVATRVTSAVTVSQNSNDTRITEYINRNLNNGIGEFRHSQPMSILGSQTSFSSIRPPTPVRYFQDTIERQTSHERMLEKQPGTSEKDIHPNPGDLENGLFTPHISSSNLLLLLLLPLDHYSWGRWCLFCFCALLAPPVFFLISMGSFDSRSSPSTCYTGGTHYYTGEQIIRRRKFSKTQKISSLILGLVWCAIALAMIGVGFGVGIPREGRA